MPGPTDAWTTLAGLARETSRIRLGTLLTAATFRLPGPLAIAVAQIDVMSGAIPAAATRRLAELRARIIILENALATLATVGGGVVLGGGNSATGTQINAAITALAAALAAV